MTQQRSHDVHLRMTRAGIASRGMYLLKSRRRCAERKSQSAILFGYQRAKQSCIGECLHEISRIALRLFKLAPVAARKARAKPAHQISNLRIGFAKRELDGIVDGSLRSHRIFRFLLW